MEGRREDRKEGGREGGREDRKEGGREGGREASFTNSFIHQILIELFQGSDSRLSSPII
jgi:hypothetical protein